MKERAPVFHQYLLQALAFTLPLLPQVVPLLIVLLVINWFWLPKMRPEFSRHWPLYLVLLLFGWFAISLAWTSHLNDGLAELETKLSLVLLPVVLMTTSVIQPVSFRKIIRFFVWGCVAAAVMCLLYATGRVINEQIEIAKGIHNDNFRYYWFFRDRVTPFFHPSYHSLYFCFGLAAMWYLKHQAAQKLTRFDILQLTLMVLLIVLLSSKAGWIGMGMLLLAFSFYLVRVLHMYKTVLLIGVGTLLVFGSLYFSVQEFQRRIDGAWYALTAQEVDATSSESSAVRRLVWKAATERAEEAGMFGYGIGSALDTLAAKYKAFGLEAEAKERLNAHNQVLHSSVTGGWIAGLITAVLLLLPFIAAIRYRNYLLIAFLGLVLLNFSVEAMLERQWGVTFYAFIFALLFTQPWKTAERTKQ